MKENYILLAITDFHIRRFYTKGDNNKIYSDFKSLIYEDEGWQGEGYYGGVCNVEQLTRKYSIAFKDSRESVTMIFDPKEINRYFMTLELSK